ncbi:MAG: Asp-tRNA(Asn)/Glu-tRNA(Gln) amidotransferase subunit GatC, partial [Candidatus Zixiibacteriota bacterium]
DVEFSMPVSKEEVRQIARLARLRLTPDEEERYSRELTVILDYFRQLQLVDTANVERSPQAEMPAAALREDNVRSSLPCDEALKNAPDSDRTYFRVPKVIG